MPPAYRASPCAPSLKARRVADGPIPWQDWCGLSKIDSEDAPGRLAEGVFHPTI
jgi:hypothetical protein